MGLGEDAVVVLGDKNVTGGVVVRTPQEADGRVGEDNKRRCGGGIFLQQKVLLCSRLKRAFGGMRGWVKDLERR